MLTSSAIGRVVVSAKRRTQAQQRALGVETERGSGNTAGCKGTREAIEISAIGEIAVIDGPWMMDRQ